MKIVVGVSGASGVVLAKRLLEELSKRDIEIHLVISEGAKLLIDDELGGEDLSKLADHIYDPKDFYAPIASGSFKTDGMVIVPCSMKTLAEVATGVSDNLLTRAADVCLKQERKLILVPREAPLSLIHLRNLVTAKEAGATIIPPLLAFYPKPKNVEDMVDFVVGKILDSLNIDNNIYTHWDGK
jgi:4-hydroxy-3-polyprenylbenzoate decarboxylase